MANVAVLSPGGGQRWAAMCWAMCSGMLCSNLGASGSGPERLSGEEVCGMRVRNSGRGGVQAHAGLWGAVAVLREEAATSHSSLPSDNE